MREKKKIVLERANDLKASESSIHQAVELKKRKHEVKTMCQDMER
jgi:hypothetical protein